MFQQFGPYRVVKQLGRGGMGAVYEGLNAETGERCAVKVLSPVFGDDEDFRTRFQIEIETLKQLDHPNIVKLKGFGEQDGHLFYTMELVEGPNLQQESQAGRSFSWEQVVEFAINVSAALKHAHDRGIVHRDLKPANLIWSQNAAGPIKLTDFGIAKLFGSTQVTMAGGVVGTVDYMSPEQAAARPVTARSDLYSLGSVMYSLLARRPPFRGPTKTQVMEALINERPLPLGRLVFGIPEELEEIIEQLLEKEPGDRIATAKSLSNRLKAMMHAHRRGVLGGAVDEPDDEPDEEGDDFEVDGDKTQTPDVTVALSGDSSTDLDKTAAGDRTSPATGPGPRPATSGNYDETVVSQSSSDTTGAAPEAPRSTSFTAVEGAAPQQPAAPRPAGSHSELLSIAGLLAALLLLGAAIWHFSQPTPAGELYAEIQAVAEAGDHSKWADVRRQIDQFLDSYPEDRRHEQVAVWREDHQWYKLWRKLERAARKNGGDEFLAPRQQAFVEAARLDNDGQAETAAAAYAKAAAAYQQSDDADAGDEDAEYLAAAQHRLEQLTRQPAEKSAAGN